MNPYISNYDKFSPPLIDDLTITSSQEKTIKNCIKLLPHFKIILIKGDASSGKYVVAKELFRRTNAIVENFDLCDFAQNLTYDLSNQHIIKYLNSLYLTLQSKLNNDNNPHLGIIYIRHYNRIVDVLTDHNSKVRFLLSLILKTFVENIPQFANIRIVITAHGCIIPEGLHWCVELTTNKDDMKYILDPYVNNNIITQTEQNNILKISKIIPVGRLLYCLRYAIAMSPKNTIPSDTDLPSKPDDFIEYFKIALSKFNALTLDVEKDVPEPIPDYDLIGVDDIIDAITVSIINPMKLGFSEIPMKKGLLLCGPPGTGKTSIGRWLAHQIKGKFYLIGGEVTSLIENFEIIVRKARENAPSVIFIDDCDLLFDQHDTYRAFLTILDGIDTNKREGVCVILTCMNLRTIPSSLLRGGRLEMTLITKLPDRKRIQIILQKSLDKLTSTLLNYDPNLGQEISSRISPNFITNLSHKMMGWNCADIHRCVNDVLRLIISKKEIDITDMFQKCISQIQEQYSLCARCESTNVNDRPHDTYII